MAEQLAECLVETGAAASAGQMVAGTAVEARASVEVQPPKSDRPVAQEVV